MYHGRMKYAREQRGKRYERKIDRIRIRILGANCCDEHVGPPIELIKEPWTQRILQVSFPGCYPYSHSTLRFLTTVAAKRTYCTTRKIASSNVSRVKLTTTV